MTSANGLCCATTAAAAAGAAAATPGTLPGLAPVDSLGDERSAAIGDVFSLAARAAPVAATAAAAIVAESAEGTVAHPAVSNEVAASARVSFESDEKCVVMMPSRDSRS
jgi:hypothetical protein